MNTPAGGDPAWSAAAKAAQARIDARLARRFDAGHPADRLIALRARAVDAQVCAAWRRCLPEDAPLALFAVGGYGRGELFPQSDIDLLVLAEPDAQQAWQAALARFVALLWDAGLEASHAVRSAEQCTVAAGDDHTEQRSGYEVVFCPMAFNNKGAYWVQKTGEIVNPYHGMMMLHCGDKVTWDKAPG